MNRIEFNNLQPGDIVTSKLTDDRCIVTANNVGRVTAVKTFDIVVPVEWSLTLKANHKKPEYKKVRSIYQKNGFKDREHYLDSLADEYDVDLSRVLAISALLGSGEDFDGLISSLKDDTGNS